MAAKSGWIPQGEIPLEQSIADLEKYGIAKAVMIGRNLEATHGFKVPNEHIAALQKRYPDKLIGFAGVDPNQGMYAVRELEKAVKELGLKGVGLDPFLHKLRMNDKKMYPIFAKCVELDVPVVLNSGAPGFIKPLSNYMSFASPEPVDEVATDFPELRIVIVHLGAPWLYQMIYIARRHPNVYIETSGITTGFRLCARPYLEAMQYTPDYPLGIPDQFVYASAYPFGKLDAYKDVIKLAETMGTPLNDETIEKFVYKNAARVLGLSSS
jgi:predicted TIM-barrel fold metal-dependent hydrolase